MTFYLNTNLPLFFWDMYSTSAFATLNSRNIPGSKMTMQIIPVPALTHLM